MDEKTKLLKISRRVKVFRQSITQEHISLIDEPGSKYLGHISPSGSSAKLIKDSIVNFIATKNIDTQKFVAVRNCRKHRKQGW